MKVTLHIPTEQFGYCEVSTDHANAEDAAMIYREYSNAFKERDGLADKEYNAFVDRYLLGESNHVEEYQRMSPKQQDTIQIIKRSLARIKAKQSK